jgi:uncharacterized protein (TIGR03435 family)
MSILAQALTAALVHFIWQGAVVGLLAWAVLFALRDRAVTVRYLVSCSALALLMILPVVTAIAFVQRAAAPGAGVSVATQVRTLLAPQPMLPIWLSPDPPVAAWFSLLQAWVLPAWSAGVLLCSLRLLLAGAQVMALGRSGEPAGEPIQALVRSVARRMGVARPVRLLISTLADVPCAVGWFRPVILLGPATAMGLTISELEAVLAHELAHIARYDYLVNLVQVVAETVLFYHPAVWWISSRIRFERELRCDELAVRSCGDALCYARALTALEKQRVQAPAIALGSTGGALLYRIQRVAGLAVPSRSARWPAMLAVSLATIGLAVNIDWAGMSWMRLAARTDGEIQRFEVASVKPHKGDANVFSIMGQPGGRFTAVNASARMLIRSAFQLQDEQIVGGPDWLGVDRYDIVAKAEEGAAFGPPAGQRPGTMLLMLRSLLADRFRLETHKETRELPIYALQVARRDGRLGPGLRPTDVDCSVPPGSRAPAAPAPGAAQRGGVPPAGDRSVEASGSRPACGLRVGPGSMTAGATRMPQLATTLSNFVGRLVVDRSGLSGGYDFDLQWTPERPVDPLGASAGLFPTPPADADRPSIFTALSEQLGLALQSSKGPVEVLVIDRIERASED